MARIVSFVVLVVILLVAAGLFFKVMANFLLPLFLAVLLAIMFAPVHVWILRKCKRRARLAALLTTVAIGLIVLAPLSVIVYQAARQGYELYDTLSSSQFDVSKELARAGERLGLKLDAEGVQHAISTKLEQWLAPLVLSTTQYVGSTLVSVAVMIIALYYFLLEGPGMVHTVMRLSPLDDKYEEQLVDQFHDLTRAVVLATVLSAVTQGLLAGIGFFVAGVPLLFLLTALAMLFAMVPFVGTAIVWIPACLYLAYGSNNGQGNLPAAIGLAVYCMLIVSTADNVIKPLVLHGRANLHPLLALLSVLGGVQALGPIGIFVGPMVVAFLQTLLQMFQTELETMDNGRRGQATTAPTTSAGSG